MGNAAFDTHAYVKRLTGAGMPEAQAEVLADEQSRLIDSGLATKRDAKELETGLKRDIKELETALKRDIKELETALKRDMKELEGSLKRDMREIEDSLKRDIRELEQRMTIRLGAMMVVAVGAVAALVKLL